MDRQGSVPCRSALIRCGIPGVDWAVNPYVGCTHGCVYCYAGALRRSAAPDEPWGTFARAKAGVADVLARQARRAQGTVVLSSATDAWQPVEARAGLARACLQALVDGALRVSVLTKSDLVLRDLDVLTRFRDLLGAWRVSVGFSLSTLDDGLAARLEPGAPPPSRRLAALRELSRAGVPTWVFTAPVLPGLTDDPDALAALAAEARRRGAGHVDVDPLTFYPAAVAGVRRVLEAESPRARRVFEAACRRPKAWRAWVRRTARAGGQAGGPPA